MRPLRRVKKVKKAKRAKKAKKARKAKMRSLSSMRRVAMSFLRVSSTTIGIGLSTQDTPSATPSPVSTGAVSIAANARRDPSTSAPVAIRAVRLVLSARLTL